MSKRASQYELGIVSGRVYPEFAQEVANRLDVELVRTVLNDQGNTEQYGRYAESIRRKDLFIFQAHAAREGLPIDVAIAEQRNMVNAARLADAPRINCVFPYSGYSRQDRKSQSGEPITGADVIKEFVRAGANRLLTVDLHSGQLQAASEVPLDHITAAPVLSKWLLQNWVLQYGRKHVTLVAPDAGRAKQVARAAEKLDIDFALVDKRRDLKTGEVVVKNVLGDIAGKHAMIWDDMVDGAGTTRSSAEGIMDHGAKTVSGICTHGILSAKAPQNIAESPLEMLVVTDTLPQGLNEELIPKLQVVSMIPLVAKAVRRIHKGKSLSKLFKGENLS